MSTWSAHGRFSALAPPDRLCALFGDPDRWPQIVERIVWARIDEPMRRGARGRIRYRGSRPRELRVLAWNPPHTAVFEVSLLLARLTLDQQLTRMHSRTVVTHRIAVTGPLAWLFVWLHGDAVREVWAAAVERADSMAVIDTVEGVPVLR